VCPITAVLEHVCEHEQHTNDDKAVRAIGRVLHMMVPEASAVTVIFNKSRVLLVKSPVPGKTLNQLTLRIIVAGCGCRHHHSV
jgi:hypothetical protein